jgi:hypothetical protein
MEAGSNERVNPGASVTVRFNPTVAAVTPEPEARTVRA